MIYATLIICYLIHCCHVNNLNTFVRGQDDDDIKIFYYYGPTIFDWKIYSLSEFPNVLNETTFIHNTTNLFIPGTNVKQDSYLMNVIASSYYKRNSINLLSLDLKKTCNITELQLYILENGPRIADALLRLFDAGLDENSLSLVGHSLGGHVISVIAREVQKRSNYTIILPRITGLDPANPIEYDVFVFPIADKGDAKFVDIIHTAAGSKHGDPRASGDANFWPNGGMAVQPGCPARFTHLNNICSHLKAYAYWAQSVANVRPKQLIAYKAQSYGDFLETDPTNISDVALMGIDCRTSARGNYYLNIKSDYGSLPVIGPIIGQYPAC